jgi:hypothetical protein
MGVVLALDEVVQKVPAAGDMSCGTRVQIPAVGLVRDGVHLIGDRQDSLVLTAGLLGGGIHL